MTSNEMEFAMTALEKIIESKYGGDRNNFHLSRYGNELHVELTYPPWEGDDGPKLRHICVDQESVRASDGIRMHYDYDRDGWSIEQPSRLSWACDDPNHDMDWQEVAFIKSWARAETEAEEDERIFGKTG